MTNLKAKLPSLPTLFDVSLLLFLLAMACYVLGGVFLLFGLSFSLFALLSKISLAVFLIALFLLGVITLKRA